MALLAPVSSASAQIIAGPDATKICAGYGGGGIAWSIGLNEGWRPSRLLSYRVVLRDPAGKVVGRRESEAHGGGWIGPFPYWDRGEIREDPVVGTNSLAAPIRGTYTFVLQLRVDPRYPDLAAVGRNDFAWPKHAGRWVSFTTRIHVFDCR